MIAHGRHIGGNAADMGVERTDDQRQHPALTGTLDADPRRVDLRAAGQIIDRAVDPEDDAVVEVGFAVMGVAPAVNPFRLQFFVIFRDLFVAAGKGVRSGARVKEMHLWDEGPTIAKIMGWQLEDADGTVIEEIIE